MSDHYYKSGEAKSYVKKTILSGKEKAAILLGELGPSTTEDMLKYFSDEEIHKLRRAMDAIGTRVDTEDEVQVLEEFLKYGMMNRLTDMQPELFDKERYAQMLKEEQMTPMQHAATNASAEDVAAVLRTWLSDNSPSTRRR
ncbi:MAG: hypothetical protein MJ178_07000 [Treponemataceae bacterium]|nr:hypothetical protein [Treponemataceae bacterium]